MSFTATPLDGSTTPIPMSSAVPDGTNTPLALEGGPAVSTGGNTLVPVPHWGIRKEKSHGRENDAKTSQTTR